MSRLSLLPASCLLSLAASRRRSLSSTATCHWSPPAAVHLGRPPLAVRHRLPFAVLCCRHSIPAASRRWPRPPLSTTNRLRPEGYLALLG
ncbi:hypothetical protein NL676_022832 [Syzygium grande]|nr:hypothetical protein NL676_022832 [Syzygium grande]